MQQKTFFGRNQLFGSLKINQPKRMYLIFGYSSVLQKGFHTIHIIKLINLSFLGYKLCTITSITNIHHTMVAVIDSKLNWFGFFAARTEEQGKKCNRKQCF